MKDRGFFDEEDFQKIKDLRRDTVETTTRFEEIITFLDGVYSPKGKKKEKELEDIDKCFEVITDRRDTVIRLSKEATTALEAIRNAAEVAKAEKRKKYNSSRRSGNGRSEGSRPGAIQTTYWSIAKENISRVDTTARTGMGG